jgi:hypothetical protein
MAGALKKEDSSSVVLPDGTLNVSLLEKEIVASLQSTRSARAENDMKKRAIQVSQTYDEFRTFVQCSEQRPVDSHELSQLLVSSSKTSSSRISNKYSTHSPNERKKSQPRQNKRVVNKDDDDDETLTKHVSALSLLHDVSDPQPYRENSKNIPSDDPAYKIRIERDWRRYQCRGNPKNTWAYLTRRRRRHDSSGTNTIRGNDEGWRIDPCRLAETVFRVEVNGDILGDLLAGLVHGLLVSSSEGDRMCGCCKSCFVHAWLSHLTVCPRFALVVSFLSKAELNHVIDICNHLDTHETKEQHPPQIYNDQEGEKHDKDEDTTTTTCLPNSYRGGQCVDDLRRLYHVSMSE